MKQILNNFILQEDQETYENIIENTYKNTVFKSTNLWILILAIIIACLGLNIDAIAVVIGAMLISPLMGPVIGIGIGLGINDLKLVKLAIKNFAFATIVSLITSTIYFLISPITNGTSELLARTSPTIFDVIIAIFGGTAAILAISSKQKGNVIPGVAIATALMPPLCTAGYGLATKQLNFFMGAGYLYIINIVFIGIAIFIMSRILKFPFKQTPNEENKIKTQIILFSIASITLIPSIYFGYDIVQQTKFQQSATNFIEAEAKFPNAYLLKKDLNLSQKEINLTFGGQNIRNESIEILQSKLKNYNLDDATLNIIQGFAYLENNNQKELSEINKLTIELNNKNLQINELENKLTSIESEQGLGKQILMELQIIYPEISSLILQPSTNFTTNEQNKLWVVIIYLESNLEKSIQEQIKSWLSTRLNDNNLEIIFYDKAINN